MPKQVDPNVKAQAEKLLLEGKFPSAVANITGLSKATVYRFSRAVGAKPSEEHKNTNHVIHKKSAPEVTTIYQSTQALQQELASVNNKIYLIEDLIEEEYKRKDDLVVSRDKLMKAIETLKELEK